MQADSCRAPIWPGFDPRQSRLAESTKNHCTPFVLCSQYVLSEIPAHISPEGMYHETWYNLGSFNRSHADDRHKARLRHGADRCLFRVGSIRESIFYNRRSRGSDCFCGAITNDESGACIQVRRGAFSSRRNRTKKRTYWVVGKRRKANRDSQSGGEGKIAKFGCGRFECLIKSHTQLRFLPPTRLGLRLLIQAFERRIAPALLHLRRPESRAAQQVVRALIAIRSCQGLVA